MADEMDRDELVRRFEELRPEIEKLGLQFGIHEPDWEPLKIVFGPFMFMGYSDGIRTYKHKWTRRYLNLDENGRAYRYLGWEHRYEEIPLEEGIAYAFDGIDQCYPGFWPKEDPPPDDHPEPVWGG